MSSARKLVVLVAGLILVGLVGIGLYSTLHKNNASNTSATYVDPLSHQTVSDPAGKAPDKFGTASDSPTYLGFDKLLDQGMTLEQLNNLKVAFYKYSKTQTQPIKEISLDVDHITSQHDSATPGSPFYLIFNVRFDRKNNYTAKVDYSDLTSVRLLLLNQPDQSVIFDSKG